MKFKSVLLYAENVTADKAQQTVRALVVPSRFYSGSGG